MDSEKMIDLTPMKTSSKFISLLTISTVLILFLTFFTIPFSGNKISKLLAKANLYNMQFPQEKVYLHMDRSSYWASDDIWFKAYLKDSPIQNCNLYVELLNSSGTIVEKKRYWAQSGLAYGDFHLKDTISTGIYQIRAYTNWMRNFDDGWLFRKDLVIWNLKDMKIDEDKRQLRENKIDIQFFPEGGTFVANRISKMAFKATDKNGKGLAVVGKIVDDSGNELVDIKSHFKGMGSFVIHPIDGRKYTAQVTIAHKITLNIDLPIPQTEGATLAIDPNDTSKLHIQISDRSITLETNTATEYLMVGQAGGVIFYRKEITTSEGVFNFDLEKALLPNGIVQFTLFDQEAIPVCERLVFINHHDFINVEIIPNKATYHTRERVQLDIDAFDKEGTPYLTNLSMSVFNPESQLKTEDYPNNILTQFLLGSALKGLIEEPAYYFKDDSFSTMLALDNLMLTHGYRHFEWEAIREDRFPENAYPAEECIQVRGSVKTPLLQKPVPGCKVTMMSLKGQFSFNEQTTDSLGKFLFSNLYFNDTVQFSLHAKNKKGKLNGYIELDKRSSVSPPPGFLPVTYQYSKENPMDRKSYLSEVSSDFIKRKWRLSDTIMLNEVKVVKSKYKFGERPMRLYEKADYELDLDLDDNELGNVFDHLSGKISNVVVDVYNETDSAFISVDYQNSRAGGSLPVLVLDGMVTEFSLIRDIPAGAFDRIEILKNGYVYGRYKGGAICFFTKRGAFAPISNSTGMKSSSIIGYSVIRKFYSPNYEVPLPVEIKDDYRNTLYWNPIVRTDSLGMAGVSFYNSDQTGEVQVVVEGVTADGKLCRGVCKFKVTQ